MLDKRIVTKDFFYFIKPDLIEVLEYLSRRESWQESIVGYELPEDGDFGNGILLFMNTTDYGEVLLNELEFYEKLKITCEEYINNYLQEKEKVEILMKKVKKVLRVKEI